MGEVVSTKATKQQLQTLRLLSTAQMQQGLRSFEMAFSGRPWCLDETTEEEAKALKHVREAQRLLFEQYEKLAKGILPED